MLMSGDHSRHAPEVIIARATATTSVAIATIRPATGAVVSGTSFSLSNATGSTVAGISMSTAPDTTGVMIRRSNGSHTASAN